ncbi:MAG: hypothetical protein NTW97_02125 [Candidatus Krumholzibacteria bacterium]|nr:hypothetical protein [Candidatus Krumholzibacteria bacterium]
MRRFDRRIAAFQAAVALIVLAQSCATFGPRRVEAPCDERFEALLSPVKTGEDVEIVGKLRLDLSRYRIRGLIRVAYSPGEGMARIDFRHSSLFGAIEEEVTILAGDSLVIYDRESGKYLGNDSSLALVRKETGCEVAPDDILVAMLLALPRCAEMRSVSIARSGETWRLKADWRKRRIEMRGERDWGTREFEQCFAGGGGCYTVSYGRPSSSSNLAYPRWVRLRRENGGERATFELIEIKAITATPSMFELNGINDR